MRIERTMTLGELIKELEQCDQDKTVKFDFGYFKPVSFDSWRGDYSCLALSYEDGGKDIKVSELLKLAKATNGAKFTGWKGGEFLMGLNTPVWVDNAGESSTTALLQLIDVGYQIIIETGYREY